MTDTDQQTDTITVLDFTPELPCESVYHSVETNIHDGAAAYWQTGPCEHTTGYRCAAVAEHLMARQQRTPRALTRACPACGFPSVLLQDLKYTRLEPK